MNFLGSPSTNSVLQKRLLAAVYSCLRPLATVLLRSGVTYQGFAEVAKRAFVHEATLEKSERGRQANTSRIAVRTGLSRKEVRRILSPDESSKSRTIIDHAGPPARVLHAWYFDPAFANELGTPRDLMFDEGNPSFSDLVRVAGGDIPAGAVRSELVRAGAVTELSSGILRPVKRYYVPADFNEKAITVLTDLLFPLVSGVEHNSNPARPADYGFIQRFAYSKLPAEVRDEFRLWSRKQATEFVESMDDWMREKGGDLERPETIISGVGVFFYEGVTADLMEMDSTSESSEEVPGKELRQIDEEDPLKEEERRS